MANNKTALIVGLVAAAIILLVVAALLAWYCVMKKRVDPVKDKRKKRSVAEAHRRSIVNAYEKYFLDNDKVREEKDIGVSSGDEILESKKRHKKDKKTKKKGKKSPRTDDDSNDLTSDSKLTPTKTVSRSPSWTDETENSILE